MKWKHQTALGHAMQMVIRNLRSYTMLSVTVVFSFSILLGYLAFSDSTLYNRYRRQSSTPITVQPPGFPNMPMSALWFAFCQRGGGPCMSPSIIA